MLSKEQREKLLQYNDLLVQLYDRQDVWDANCPWCGVETVCCEYDHEIHCIWRHSQFYVCKKWNELEQEDLWWIDAELMALILGAKEEQE